MTNVPSPDQQRRTVSRRFKRPKLIAIAASAAAVAFAIGPNWDGEYAPDIAVLTLTLIAIVWYTYYSYLAVHREVPGRVGVDISMRDRFRVLSIKVANPSPRFLQARLHLDLWVDGAPISTGETWQGAPGHEVELDPGEELPATIDLSNTETFEPDNEGGGTYTGATECRLRFRATWVDDLGDEGATSWKYWKGNLVNHIIRRVLTTAEVSALFGHLSTESNLPTGHLTDDAEFAPGQSA